MGISCCGFYTFGLLIKIFGIFTFQSVKRTGIIVFSLHLFPRMNPSMNQRNRNRKYSSALAVHINGDSDSDSDWKWFVICDFNEKKRKGKCQRYTMYWHTKPEQVFPSSFATKNQ